MIEFLKKNLPGGVKYQLKRIIYKRRLKKIIPMRIKKTDQEPNNKVVYTCITGGYDDLIIHNCINLNWDYICFTDNRKLLDRQRVGAWVLKPLAFNKLDNQRNSRWHKLFPNKLFPKYDYSIWIDSSLNILDNFIFDRAEELIRAKKIISQPIHSVRNCIYKEAQEVIKLNLDEEETVKEQIEIIKRENYPKNNGLKVNTLIFREHNNPLCMKIMEEWWWWLINYSRRDQLSFNYVTWKNNFESEPFSEDREILQRKSHFMFMTGRRKNREICRKDCRKRVFGGI